MTRHLNLYTPYFYMLEVRAIWQKIKRMGTRKLGFKIMKTCWKEFVEDMEDNE